MIGASPSGPMALLGFVLCSALVMSSVVRWPDILGRLCMCRLMRLRSLSGVGVTGLANSLLKSVAFCLSLHVVVLSKMMFWLGGGRVFLPESAFMVVQSWWLWLALMSMLDIFSCHLSLLTFEEMRLISLFRF